MVGTRYALRLLRQGHTRREAATQVKVALSTIRLETRRGVHFALALRDAEVEGQEFRRVFTGLFVPGRVRLESHPVISTPKFEREKEFLISRGVSPQRLVAAGFGEFQPIDPDRTEEAFSRNRRIELKLTER